MSDTDDGAKGMQDCPPLPDILPEDSRRGTSGKPLLADGCYFLAYGRDVDVWYVGTLRVESRSGRLFASGDLYAFDMAAATESQPIGLVSPPGPGIPIFPIANYTYYLRVVNVEPAEAGFILTFEAHRFFPKGVRKLNGEIVARWVLDGSFTAKMLPGDAPPGHPAPDRFFIGDIPTDPGDPGQRAQLQMGWVSPLLRRAVIEIDRVPDVQVPQGNGAGVTWQSVFRSFGWEVELVVSNDDITKNDGPVWQRSAADAAMRNRRDSSDLDAEWRYYILVAQLIVAPADGFGYMYHPKREALFMASELVFPQSEAQWGTLRGKRFDTTVAFFRTAVHEIGHAMGLGHDEGGFHFMRPTASIAQEATAAMPFPANIEWCFDPDDEDRLRHWPDIAVRPGGAELGIGGGLPLPEAQRV